MTQRWLIARRLLALAVAVAVLPTTIAGGLPAMADTGPSSSDVSVVPGLQPCVDLATRMKAEAWTCTADGLSITKNSSGKAASTFVSLKSTDYSASAISEKSSSTLTVSAAAADDYDSWCENGSICHRIISNYIEETKGNAAWGDQDGAKGSYDAIIRTTLNGRQANWKTTVIWDSGPALTFNTPYMQCLEDSFFPIICGTFNMSTANVSSASWRWNWAQIYGNKLNNSDEYHGAFHTHFTPAGYPPINAATLSTTHFKCLGADNCYFP